jgi:hypothetical protein
MKQRHRWKATHDHFFPGPKYFRCIKCRLGKMTEWEEYPKYFEPGGRTWERYAPPCPPGNMSTYLLHGFYRQDPSKKVRVLVDSNNDETDSPFAKAKEIAGYSICFITARVVHVAISDDCKSVVLNGEEELYARVPQLAPSPRRRSRSECK